jgi:hypothetical protein
MCETSIWDTIGQVLSGGLTLFFAGVVAFVAVQQWKINKRLAEIAQEQLKLNGRQYRLALFEKRLAIYNAVLARLVEVVNDMDSPFQKNVKFIQETKDNEFLFGPEVVEFINNIWKRGNDLMAVNAMTLSRAERQTEIIDWFDKQRIEARKVFFKYINLTEAV